MLVSMRVDAPLFVALTAAIAACHDAEPARTEIAVVPERPAAVASVASPPVVDASAPSLDATVPVAAEAEGAAAPPPESRYVDDARAAGRCEEQRFRPHVAGAEGSAPIVDRLADACYPLEFGNIHAPCTEGAMGCTTMVNSLHVPIAQRVLACLRRKHGAQVCAPGAVRNCVVDAMSPTHPRAEAVAICGSLVASCAAAGKTLPLDDCARLVSSMHKCHGLQRALAGLGQKCSVNETLDDWVASWGY
jgi:hypothetical protein